MFTPFQLSHQFNKNCQNQDLKTSLFLRPSPPKRYPETSFSPLRNPLPRPPEPVSSKHIPTFAQAISEATNSPAGSIFSGSVYNPATLVYGSSHEQPPSPPGPPPRETERFSNGVVEDRYTIPTGRSRKKRGKGRETPHSHSYRHDLGYFDEGDMQESTSFSSNYPTSAAIQSSTPTQSLSRSHGPISNSSLSGEVISGTYTARNVVQFDDTDRKHPAYSTDHPYSALHMQFENTSQPVDAFTLTSSYLREYSAGFINGQEAALGTRSFARPPTENIASRGSSRTNPQRDDMPDSLIYTAESAEGEVRSRTLGSRSRSRSRRATSSNNLASSSSPLVSPPTQSRRHLSVVSLPSISSHSHPSPSVSLSSNVEHPNHNSDQTASSELHGQQVESPTFSIASSGPHLITSLTQDSVDAAARRSPSGRTIESWGTIYSNAQSNSLISDLRGLPPFPGDAYDNASVRSRGTRETRFSIDFGDRDSLRDSRRHSRTSQLSGRSVRSDVDVGTRESSPARPVGTMVGVLPLDDHDAEARQVLDTTYPSIPSFLDRTDASTNRPRSSTAMDRRVASDSTVRNYGSNRTSSQTSHAHASRPTDAQRIAANAGWSSWNNNISSSRGTSESRFDYGQGPVESRHRSRDREDRHRQHRSNRDDVVGNRRQRMAHRSQTSIGANSSAWLWDADSDVHLSPLSYSSSLRMRNRHEQLSPTSQRPATQLFSSTNPSTSSSRSHRSNRHRSYNHDHNDSSIPTRPSLLSSDSLPAFPVSVESTDDERYPNLRNRTSDDGRSTRVGIHANDLSSNTANANMNVTSSPLQSFGNALGLELRSTNNGISIPTPVTRISTQNYLRSWE